MLLTGSCFCGAIQYEISRPLREAQSCHCSRCRKVFSGAGSAFGFLDGDCLRWVQGEDHLSRYATHESWELAFCGTCGSTLGGMYEGIVRGVTLGTIDGDPGIQLARHIYVGSKAPWDHIGGHAPQYEEGPEE